MSTAKTPQHASVDNEYAWFREGIASDTREDRIAEAVALIALLFSLGIGLVIALLPVSAGAAAAASPSLQLQAARVVPAHPGKAGQQDTAVFTVTAR